MIPDWIPNIHPFIVHFPIALLITAVLFDAARLFFKNNWLHNAVLTLYSAGTTGLLAAFLSGRQAVETVTVTGDAISVVTSHEDWALYTLIFFTVFTLLRLWTWWKNFEVKQWVLSVMIVLAFTGTTMLWYTGELGAKLVYKHGVAVGEIDRLEQQIDSLHRDLAVFREESAPVAMEGGSWIWRIGPGTDQIIREEFIIAGNDDIAIETDRIDGIHHIALSPGSEQSFLLFGEAISSVDGRIELNTDDFNGEFSLVHHYRDPENYQYLRLTGSELNQGQVKNGSDNILGSGRVNTGDWFTLRVTADGRHFYGYQNQQTIVHTHAEEMEPGITGFSLAGEGELKIRLVEFRTVN